MSTEASSELKKEILSVRKLLQDRNLTIPEYQRPYKWEARHVQQLFSDVVFFSNKSKYRFGTIVFHREGEQRKIVDGQQRIITLLLTLHALIKKKLNENKLQRSDLKEQLGALQEKIINPNFSNSISKTNIHNNYLEITRLICRSDFTEDHIDFLLNKCEFVSFELNDISEAFQFFDSQNARGRDLDPHDLLKAFHLREFSEKDGPLKAATVEHWENSEAEELAALFAQYLYRIRNWSKGVSARYFSKEDTPLFKGVNLDKIQRYPYVGQIRIAHHFIDHYNSQYERAIDGNQGTFPFQVDQIIINGRRFFEYTNHYKTIIENFQVKYNNKDANEIIELDGYAKAILETLKSYKGRHRVGDGYTRLLFDCLLLYYIDKFGNVELSRAIEKIFIWAYSIRLKMQVLQLATVDNYVYASDLNLFMVLKDATVPFEFLSTSLPVVTEIKSTSTKEIVNLFEEMNYYAK